MERKLPSSSGPVEGSAVPEGAGILSGRRPPAVAGRGRTSGALNGLAWSSCTGDIIGRAEATNVVPVAFESWVLWVMLVRFVDLVSDRCGGDVVVGVERRFGTAG